MRSSLAMTSTWRAALAAGSVVLVAGLLILAACGDDDGDPPTGTPTASPTPTATATKRPPVPTSSPPVTELRLLIREFTATEDVIWKVDPLAPEGKEEVARIPHREGYGIKPSLSPDGTLLAYLSLPDFAFGVESSQAEAFVLDLETKEVFKVAEFVDMTYKPLWTPDSKILYLRRYAGAEFLNATGSIIRLYAPRSPEESPTPSPTLPPDVTPAPTLDPIQIVLSDTVANVLSFSPIGFSDDNRSMYFVQVDGGTGDGTLIAIYAPGSSEAIAAQEAIWADNLRAAYEANKAAADAAAAAGQPPPVDTMTPAPTPAPDARFVVQISEGVPFDYSVSPDTHKVAYLDQQFVDGDILNRAFVADIIAATTAPLPTSGLDVGHHLRPVWFPDGRLTIGVLASAGGPGSLALMSLDGTSVTYLAQPDAGFDTPMIWAPDGSWLAVQHNTGSSLINAGTQSLVLVSQTGQRVTVIEGRDNSNADSVLGWVAPQAAEGE
jgi:hypothetical protein